MASLPHGSSQTSRSHLAWPLLVGLALSCGPTPPPLVPGVDGSLGVSAPQPFYYDHPGTPYVISVSNLGDTDGGPPVQVTVQFSEGVSIASHTPSSWSCTGAAPFYLCTFDDILPAGGVIPDLELSLAIGPFDVVKDEVRICTELRLADDVDPSNNQACLAYPAHAITAEYDLEITKALWTVGLSPENEIAYSITVKNLGPDIVLDPIVVEDVLPAGLVFHAAATSLGVSCASGDLQTVTCTIAWIGSNPATNTRHITIITTKDPALAGVVENCASVSAPQDLNLVNNTACHAMEIGVPAPFDLQVTAEIMSVPSPGSTGVYRYYIHNAGPNPTSELLHVLVDAPPPGTTLSYLSGINGSVVPSTNIGNCTPVGAKLSCPVSLIFPVGETRIFWMSFFMDDDAGGSAPGCLSVAPNGDTDASNNEACLSLLAPPPDGDYAVSTKLSAGPEPRQDQIGSLALSLTHVGTEETPGPVLGFVRLPGEVSFVGVVENEAFTCVVTETDPSGQLVTCIHDGPLAAGAREDITLAVFYKGAGSVVVCSEVSPRPSGVDPLLTKSCAPIDIVSATDPVDAGQ
jgi:uncharacterized repeat protein (TIGR01451 family)